MACALPSAVQSSIALTSFAQGNVAGAICAATASNVALIILTPLIGWLVDNYSYDPVFILVALLPQMGFLLAATLVGVVEQIAMDGPGPAGARDLDTASLASRRFPCQS